ncbi:hypothetical protein A2862_00185 [Candidatus Roizmanbacteria bacterium RIFCSPHIGHO2_01_FULL_38_41]|uniref:Recombinase RmuC n=1 Tax=Candidatus Roizmanbacteria bacterium RIFCSPHIGHO2_02_FULL_37_24 TaxID=1802037 RepID=A0A1F7GYA3_9BACT|nr:MAG: hypothetical protein A2862_00185 [Candidatus Roizmanbacteria bacterium RIFCSPHIGHO2_01_FULL_38_41]OGK24009.1 MAG: hypothetical protein A3C24_02880 [Candidatus Roizmanbacteria bacterium RIFCSPHIGHO2_02_FULL_37_24]OGK32377.1 MAG: hypothetical protein A3E10_04310 [Candidatus Roizmanbacteria bacterium RIFCSPHIGHO2_12_FULL_37_23]OGK44263.1 MAG: hypothetical protein A2956_00245 [Candidatus Roizmanbacteria bacterium RIFCSPLOWO2_01_FULL_37_57]OGK61413.1 MAG: hypothetical protein A3G65_01715 [Ca
MSNDILLGLLIGAVIAAGFLWFLQKRREKDGLPDAIAKHLAELIPQYMKDAREQLIQLAEERLGGERKAISTDLENKRKTIERMVDTIQKELRDTDRTSQSILQQMKDHQKITQELSVTTEGLKKVLTNNQLRGQFGEQVAEDLLKMVGFVKGVDFEFNKAQDSRSTRPDFTIFLPDKTKINVDVKFPYANLQRATETEDRASKQQFLKAFAKDVKEKISQVTTRDYINPEERTVDFVILFVPNEMIFSYIYDKMNEIWREAMVKKVILAGPFSFTAILRMVRQAYDNFRYQKNIHQIVAHVREFEKQFDLYNEEFDKLGNQIQTVSSTFHKVETTRTRQLSKVVEKIQLESGEEDKTLLIEKTGETIH